MHPWEKAIYLPLVRRGAHLKMKGVTFRQVTEVRMVCDRDLPWHVDGELMDAAREFVITRRSETMLFRRPKPQTGAMA